MMNEQVLNYFIDRLAEVSQGVEQLRPELLTLFLPLLHKEPRRDGRQLGLIGDIPGNLYLKLSGFSKGYIPKATGNETAPLIWLGPAIIAEWRALYKKKPARYEIYVEPRTPVYSMRRADLMDIAW